MTATGSGVGEYELRLERLEVDFRAGDATVGDLAGALADAAEAAGENGDFEAEQQYLDRLRDLHTEHGTGSVRAAFARALGTAATVHGREELHGNEVNAELLEAHREKLDELHREEKDPGTRAHLAHATAETAYAFAYTGKTDAGDTPTETTDARMKKAYAHIQRLEDLYEEYPEDEIASQLGRSFALVGLSATIESEAADEMLDRAEKLHETHTTVGTALGLASVLCVTSAADGVREDVDAIDEKIRRVKTLADEYPENADAIREWLVVPYCWKVNVYATLDNVTQVEEMAQQSRELYRDVSSPFTATWVADVTELSVRVSLDHTDVTSAEAKLDEIAEIHDRYPNSTRKTFARSLKTVGIEYVITGDIDKAETTADRLSDLVAESDDPDIAEFERQLREQLGVDYGRMQTVMSKLSDGEEITLLDLIGDVKQVYTGPAIAVTPWGLAALVAGVGYLVAALFDPAGAVFSGIVEVIAGVSLTGVLPGVDAAGSVLWRGIDFGVYVLAVVAATGAIFWVGVDTDHHFRLPGLNLFVHRWPIPDTTALPSPIDSFLVPVFFAIFVVKVYADLASMPLFVAQLTLFVPGAVVVVLGFRILGDADTGELSIGNVILYRGDDR